MFYSLHGPAERAIYYFSPYNDRDGKNKELNMGQLYQ